MSRISFSLQAKQELARIIPKKPCCRRAELIGLLRSCGYLTVVGGETSRFRLVWETEIAAVARKVFLLCRTVAGVDPSLSAELRRRPKRRRFFRVEVLDSDALRCWLCDAGGEDCHSHEEFDILSAIQRPIAERTCCKRSFLRGSFLGFGSVTDPNKEHHLEMGPCESVMLRNLKECLSSFQIKCSVTERRGQKWLYLKDSEHIVTLLQAMGANLAVLHYQDVRLMREMRSRVNRMVNAETANLTKIVEAGLRQIEAIQLVQLNIGYEKLPPMVRQVAELRMSHPELSLRELGEMAEPALTKSRVQNYMNQLQKMADEFRT